MVKSESPATEKHKEKAKTSKSRDQTPNRHSLPPCWTPLSFSPIFMIDNAIRRKVAAVLVASMALSLIPSVVSAAPGCDLNCINGGECRPSSELGPFSPHSSSTGGYYCLCPAGYSGVECGEESKLCGELPPSLAPAGSEQKQRRCRHGTPCVTTASVSGTLTQSCLCSSADGQSAYAGEECDVKATSYCGEGGKVNRIAFCTNGGTCKDGANEENPGCECPPSYEGPHCEYVLGTMPNKSAPSTGSALRSDSAAKFVGGAIIALVSTMAICVVYVATKNFRDRREERRMLAAAADATSDMALDPRGSFRFERSDSEIMGGGARETELTRKGGNLYSGVDGSGTVGGGLADNVDEEDENQII